MLNAFLSVKTKEFSGVCFNENLNAFFLTEMHSKEHLITTVTIENTLPWHLALKSSLNLQDSCSGPTMLGHQIMKVSVKKI